MTPKRSAPSSAEYEHGRIIERPDGYYWLDDRDGENGPFRTLGEAVSDMEASGDTESDVPDYESLEEAEAELGLNWIDPLTGEPGEEGAPRIEDH
ncbi:MAG TPA: hypothetical protein VIQ01_09115 [Burkholderiales bacterium]